MSESVGLKLKKAREKKHLSLEEISQKTKIHPKVLQSLEEDRAEDHLSRTYVRGFLKSYAQAVGLDGEAVVREYSMHSARSSSLPALSMLDTFSFEEEKDMSPWVRRSIGLIFVIGAIFLGWLGVSKIRGNSEKFFPSAEVQAVRYKRSSLHHPLHIPDNEPLKLKVRVTDNTWVAVRADGRLIYQGLLAKGREESWGGQRLLELSLSDGGGVLLELNHKQLGVPGEKGRAVERLLMTHEGWGIEGKS